MVTRGERDRELPPSRRAVGESRRDTERDASILPRGEMHNQTPRGGGEQERREDVDLNEILQHRRRTHRCDFEKDQWIQRGEVGRRRVVD
ncbi:hypothetical protein F2Q70_00036606 [Brassica cretica]|uniref:Uncharacterized protein n=1 Tax=Brassica cretica TaxID=69181 RepID=A0A8S9JUP0_BRACR|nr:hypothetical protein F2Q68_00031790 [Brassica cretica]KAF2585408.1 hypothetical protein F2Q70_00036606 [Brassica cretica]